MLDVGICNGNDIRKIEMIIQKKDGIWFIKSRMEVIEPELFAGSFVSDPKSSKTNKHTNINSIECRHVPSTMLPMIDV